MANQLGKVEVAQLISRYALPQPPATTSLTTNSTLGESIKETLWRSYACISRLHANREQIEHIKLSVSSWRIIATTFPIKKKRHMKPEMVRIAREYPREIDELLLLLKNSTNTMGVCELWRWQYRLRSNKHTILQPKYTHYIETCFPV